MTEKTPSIVRRVAAALIVSMIGGLVYLAEPYVAVSEVRTTGNLETVRGIYGRACGEDFISGYEGDRSLGRLALVVQEGGIGPEETDAVVPDNVFEITGYRYKQVRRNLFTGKLEETPSPRFDVVKWHAIPPYRVSDKQANIRQANTPLGWSSTDSAPKFLSSLPSRRGGC